MALRDLVSGLFGRRQAPAVRAQPARQLGQRRFAGAANDRLVSDLLSITGLVSGQNELRSSLRAMRINSRRLAHDNEYAKRFFQLLRNNVVGPRGFDLQMKITKPRGGFDTRANGQIETAYREFSSRGLYTACGSMNRRTFDRAAMTQCARDGEVLIEVLHGRQFNRFGLAFQLLDPDLLDESLNIGRQGFAGGQMQGVEIRAGVERDRYGRAVAYWMHGAHPADDVVNTGIVRHRRVPAERVIHRYLAEEQRAGTTRGVPWLYVAMRRLAMLGGYEEAALVNARSGAAKMGFYKQPESSIGSPIGGAVGDGTQVAGGTDAEGNLMDQAEPGVIGVLPPGWDFTTYNPTYPSEAMDGFVKGMLRAFAAGVGVNYNVLASDLEGVNYSSLRQGALDDRDTYEALQQWYVDDVARPMFELWLRFALDMGQIGTLPADAFDRLNTPLFIPRTWRWVDPLKEVSASEKELGLRLTSRTRLCAEQGIDFEQLVEEIASEEKLLRENGVTFAVAAAAAAANAPAAPAAAEDNGAAGAPARPIPEEEDPDA